jgi:hypothetical protein
LIKKGKLDCFVEKERRKSSPRKFPKKKRSSEGGESPPRKTRSTTEKEQADIDNDSGAEKETNRIFLMAIMGGLSATNNTPRGTTKKIVEVMETHGTPPKTAKKRLLLGFTDNEKVNGVSNEDLPLVIVVAIRDHNIARCLVDEGSSIDIMYQDAFEKLGMKSGDISCIIEDGSPKDEISQQ